MEDLLQQLEEQYPSSDRVRDIFTQYCRLTHSAASAPLAVSVPPDPSPSLHTANHHEQTTTAGRPSHKPGTHSKPQNHPNTKPETYPNWSRCKGQRSIRRNLRSSDPLVVSINVVRGEENSIMVDQLVYKGGGREEEESEQRVSTTRRGTRRSKRLSLRVTSMRTSEAQTEGRREEEDSFQSRHSTEQARRKRRRSKECGGVQVVSVEEGGQHCPLTRGSPPPLVSAALGQETWCECYQPHLAADVIGNGSAVHQLRSWLSHWKDKCLCSVESKPRSGPWNRNQSKSQASTASNSLSATEDPDFRTTKSRSCACPPPPSTSLDDSFDSCDYEGERKEEEEECPAVLLCGASGSGKTAAVMACAQELGFKVSEQVGGGREGGGGGGVKVMCSFLFRCWR